MTKSKAIFVWLAAVAAIVGVVPVWGRRRRLHASAPHRDPV